MKTFLPQNKFYSTATSPPVVDSDGVGAKPILAPSEAVIGLTRDHPVAADLIQSSCGEASDDVGRTRKQPSMASRLTPPGPQDHILDDMEQLLGVAGKRRRLKLPRFVPDYEGMEAAINDPGAPRLRADDPVWTDASPLFLRDTA